VVVLRATVRGPVQVRPWSREENRSSSDVCATVSTVATARCRVSPSAAVIAGPPVVVLTPPMMGGGVTWVTKTGGG
jgi:hypothetical protein